MAIDFALSSPLASFRADVRCIYCIQAALSCNFRYRNRIRATLEPNWYSLRRKRDLTRYQDRHPCSLPKNHCFYRVVIRLILAH